MFSNLVKDESIECDPEKEFRCKNGLCIPISILSAEIEACLDRTDGTKIFDVDLPNYLSELCFEYPSFECDETNHGWKRFSCNNGQFISYSNLTSTISSRGKLCANDHHLTYLKELFNIENENECWKSMICLIGFDYLYPNLNCFNENIEQYCLNEFYFPSNSVVYSFMNQLFIYLVHVFLRQLK